MPYVCLYKYIIVVADIDILKYIISQVWFVHVYFYIAYIVFNGSHVMYIYVQIETFNCLIYMYNYETIRFKVM